MAHYGKIEWAESLDQSELSRLNSDDEREGASVFWLFFGFFFWVALFGAAIDVYWAFSEGEYAFVTLAGVVFFSVVFLVLAVLFVVGRLRSRGAIVVGPEDVCAFAGRRRDAAEWREPLSAYEGIRCRGVEGGEVSDTYEVELVHPMDSRSVILWDHFQSAIGADRASRTASKVLGVPTLELLGFEVFRRHAQDQERPLADLIGERRVRSDFALADGTPRGITLYEDDAETCVHAGRYFAMWITDTDVRFVRSGRIPLAEIRHVAVHMISERSCTLVVSHPTIEFSDDSLTRDQANWIARLLHRRIAANSRISSLG